MTPMILQNLVMPFFSIDSTDQIAQSVYAKVNNIVTSATNEKVNLSLDPEISIYAPDNHSSFNRNYYSVKLYGGLNGTGLWSNYFNALSNLMLKLESVFEDTWLIRFEQDCTDDAFAAVIGIYPHENELN